MLVPAKIGRNRLRLKRRDGFESEFVLGDEIVEGRRMRLELLFVNRDGEVGGGFRGQTRSAFRLERQFDLDADRRKIGVRIGRFGGIGLGRFLVCFRFRL